MIDKYEIFFHWLQGFSSCFDPKTPPDAETWSYLTARLSEQMHKVETKPEVQSVPRPSGPIHRARSPLTGPLTADDPTPPFTVTCEMQ